MKKIILLTLAVFFTGLSFGQTVFGTWKTVDDSTGEAKSLVEIYEENGKVYGKIIKIMNPDRQDARCDKCNGKDEGEPILGMTIIRGLQKDGDEYNSGKILDPESGKLYKCYIALEDEDSLKVRGYIGFSLIGRTQYWERTR